MKSKKKENILITISILRKIMEIFFGPFLIAYFIKTSKEGLLDLSIYNMMSYLIIGICGFIVAYIVSNKFKIGMFRIGVVLNFFYIITIVILKEKILNYLYLVAFLYGISAICYWFPYNLFIADQIDNKNRTEYEIKRKTASLLVSVLIPIFLGGMITLTDFYITAILIAAMSLIQIFLSFFINPKQDMNYRFTIIQSFKKLSQNPEVKAMFKTEFLKGFNISDGVLTTVVTVLILNAFKTDMNLGIITSASSILTIVLSYLYSKFFKEKNDKIVILTCSTLPVLCLFILLGITNNITLILYYVVYQVLLNLLVMIMDIRLFNLSNIKLIREDNQVEFWAIREGILNIGRILGYFILFIIVILKKDQYLNYFMIFLTLTIPTMGYTITKVKKHNKV